MRLNKPFGYIFVCFLVLLNPVFSFAEESVSVLKISLQDAIEMAIKESENVQEKANLIQEAVYNQRKALSMALPSVSAGSNYNYYPGVPTIDVSIPGVAPISVPMKKDFDLSISGGVNQNIFTFGKIRNAMNAALSERRVREFDKESQIRETSYDAALAYITVLVTSDVIRIAKNSYENALKTQHTLDERFQYGRIPKSDNIKASADVAVRLPSLKQSELDNDLALRTLKTIIGVPRETKLILTDNLAMKFPKYDEEKSVEDMYNIEPRLKMLKSKIELDSSVAKAKLSEMLPTLSGYGQYSYFGQSNHSYIGASNLDHLGTLGLNLSIPIWNGGYSYNEYKRAKLDKVNSELSLKRTKKYMELDLRNAISQYNYLLETYHANIQAVSLSKEAFNAMFETFKAGGVTLTELNDAELQLTRSEIERALTLFEIHTAIAKIEKLISGEGENSWQSRFGNGG